MCERRTKRDRETERDIERQTGRHIERVKRNDRETEFRCSYRVATTCKYLPSVFVGR